MENYHFVYKTTNLLNNKIYVGQHLQQETSAFDGYIGSGKLLKQAVKKNGKENFIREVIEFCTSATINEREIYWINALSATNAVIGYNLSVGGTGFNRIGFITSESTKEKLRKIRLGKVPWNKGIPRTKEEKEKMSLSHIGKKLSNDTKNKMSIIHNEIKKLGDLNHNCKYNYILNDNQNYWSVFNDVDRKKIKKKFNYYKSDIIIYNNFIIKRELKQKD